MTPLGWLAVILLVLLLLGQLKVGVRMVYEDGVPELKLKLGGFVVSPPEEKEAKSKKEKQDKPQKAKKPKAKMKPAEIWALVERFMPLALDVGRAFYRTLVVDELVCHIIIPGADKPDVAAMRYGVLNTLLETSWTPLVEAFHIEDGDAGVQIDFERTDMMLYAKVMATLRVRQILWIVVRFGIRAFKQYQQHRKIYKIRKAV